MLDAIAQTLAEQAAKPAVPVTVTSPTAALIAPQQTVVPTPKPTISAPESLTPSFLPQSTRDASPPPTTAKPSSAATSNDPDRKPLTVNQPDEKAQPSLTTRNQAANAISQLTEPNTTEQATAKQRLVLDQRLAELVAKEKLLKEAKLRANLEADAIASAQAGQFSHARRLAQDPMLPPDRQAALLAEINAIANVKPPTRAASSLKRVVPKPLPPVAKAWTPSVAGRSVPSVSPYTPPQEGSAYSYVSPPAQEYVSYSFNGFGRTIGGFGVVVDSNTTEATGQSWMSAYAQDNPFDAELWNGLSLIFPLSVPAPITSPFGWRVHPIRGDRRLHSGTDLGAPMGTPVLAAASGKVALSDWLGGYGLAIILSHHDNTQETLYGHLSQVFVKPGQWVEKGTIIGRVGSTGLSTGPHLHFELRQKTANGWQAIDPGAQLKYALARLIKARQSAG
ncbi:MAG: peptidoglycan DD-metalloendopeptidase family protein [Leptolyngbya sp. BL-A-14]